MKHNTKIIPQFVTLTVFVTSLLVGAMPAHAQMLSVYVGNEPAALAPFESWLGRPADGVQLHTGFRGWSDYVGCVGWLRDVYRDVDRTKFWSIPLIPGESLDKTDPGGSLAEAASTNDTRYVSAWTTIAKALVAGQPEGKIYVRTGWEFNADWFPWAATDGRAKDYATTFRKFVTTFRGVSDRFVFEWCPNIGDKGMNPADAYPGDEFVDIVGFDFYYDVTWDSKAKNGAEAWAWKVKEKYGLKWIVDFAKAHRKPIAYSEWGVNNPDGTAYLAAFAKWMKNSPVPVVYQNYWNSNAAFAGKLSDGQYPPLAKEFLKTIAPLGAAKNKRATEDKQ